MRGKELLTIELSGLADGNYTSAAAYDANGNELFNGAVTVLEEGTICFYQRNNHIIVSDFTVSELTKAAAPSDEVVVHGASFDSIFVNDGIYTKPYTFYRVEDADGNVLLENGPQSSVAIKESTAYLMREMLRSVISSGTGYEAAFSGMSQGGKTGTTNDERDRYFVGFTPYYCAAVWTGFRSNEQIWIGGNPAANLWREVMSRVHANLSDPGFHSATGVTTVTVCADSGLLATDACTHDLRGNRVRTVTVAADTAPTQHCNVHKMVKWCKDGKHLATDLCPKESVTEVAVLDFDREIIKGIKAGDHQYLLKILSAETLDGKDNKECPVHNEQWKKKQQEEEEKKKKEEEEKNKPKPTDPTLPEDPTPTNPDDPITPGDPTEPEVPDGTGNGG